VTKSAIDGLHVNLEKVLLRGTIKGTLILECKLLLSHSMKYSFASRKELADALCELLNPESDGASILQCRLNVFWYAIVRGRETEIVCMLLL